LTEGKSYPREQLIEELREDGYREDDSGSLPPGRYRTGKAGTGKSGFAVHVRSFPRPDGTAGGGLVEVSWRGSRVSRLRRGGEQVESVSLEPPLLASYYGPQNQERQPVELKEVPE